MHTLALWTRSILKDYHGSLSTAEEADKMRKTMAQKDALPIALLLKSLDH